MEITAAVTRAPGEPFLIETLDLEEPRPDEVLVRIVAVGVCHTDVAARDGVLPVPLPVVLGHEGSGVVESVGRDVTKVKPGDRVALTFNSCGRCESCRNEMPAYCVQFAPLNLACTRQDGTTPVTSGKDSVSAYFFGQSSFASHALANECNVVRIADDDDFTTAAPLGCGVQTGAGAVMNVFRCPPGSSLIVFGAGSVGLSAVLAAVVNECASIVVVEPTKQRRMLAIELGATHSIDPAEGSVVEQVRAAVPDGLGFAFDTTGVPAVLSDALQCLATRGTLGMVGIPPAPTDALNLNLFDAIQRGLRVVGIVEGESHPDTFIPHLLALQRQGRFPVDRLITTFPFTEINEAVEAQHQGTAIKAVLVHEPLAS